VDGSLLGVSFELFGLVDALLGIQCCLGLHIAEILSAVDASLVGIVGRRKRSGCGRSRPLVFQLLI